MKRSIGLWQLFGFAVTSLVGTILHFLYDLTGGSVLVSPFSGVNESTWEHMKLLFWPMFIYAVIQRFFAKDIGLLPKGNLQACSYRCDDPERRYQAPPAI